MDDKKPEFCPPEAEIRSEDGRLIGVNMCRIPQLRNDHLDHEFPLGQVVVLTTWDDRFVLGAVVTTAGEQQVALGFKGQIKLIVVGHHRDCDGTPLYILSLKPIGFPEIGYYDREAKRMVYPSGRGGVDHSLRYSKWVDFYCHGISGSCLKSTGEFVPLQWDSIYDYEEHLANELRSMR